MTVRGLFDYFTGNADWVNKESVADGIRFGEPDRRIKKVGTGWCACAGNLRAAANDGCDLFIAHEIPFAWETKYCEIEALPWYKTLTEILQKSGMALMNLHDTWDHYPEFGVRDAFAKLCGLGMPEKLLDYIHPNKPEVTTGKNSIGIYKIPEQTAEEFARQMLGKISKIGAPGLCLNGDGKKVISRIAIGVGCHVPSVQALNAGAELLVNVYDRAGQLASRIPLADSGAVLITVEHSVAEAWSMGEMARCINENINGLTAKAYFNEPVGVLYACAR